MIRETIQLCRFQPGAGFVLHKMQVGQSLYSAWFSESGELLDAERIDARGRSCNVRWDKLSPAVRELRKIGLRYTR
jgi:hypothetical protein